MEIKAKCKFDYQSVKSAYYMMMCGKRNPKKCFLGLIIFFAVALAMLVGLKVLNWVLWKEFDMDSVWTLCWNLFLIALIVFVYFIVPKLQFKMLKHMQNMEQEYVFSEESFTVICLDENFKGQSEIKYSIIPKVMENSKYFFIFQNGNQAFIVDKSTITGGTAEEIREKLSSFVPKKKYIVCKY